MEWYGFLQRIKEGKLNVKETIFNFEFLISPSDNLIMLHLNANPHKNWISGNCEQFISTENNTKQKYLSISATSSFTLTMSHIVNSYISTFVHVSTNKHSSHFPLFYQTKLVQTNATNSVPEHKTSEKLKAIWFCLDSLKMKDLSMIIACSVYSKGGSKKVTKVRYPNPSPNLGFLNNEPHGIFWIMNLRNNEMSPEKEHLNIKTQA